jgi:hypothetical protein
MDERWKIWLSAWRASFIIPDGRMQLAAGLVPISPAHSEHGLNCAYRLLWIDALSDRLCRVKQQDLD